ncbi:MAG: LptF/LptG family permease [Planctomycetota bacterium]|nr:LptF/LptG family permease [Planctomycetota bacterium]
MLRIQRALLIELLILFVLITFVITCSVFLGVSLQLMRDGGGALGGALLTTMLPKLLPLSLAYAVPFAWLAATALVLGRWVADHEVTAIQSSGVHLRTLAAPILAAGVLLSVGGMWWNGWRVPQSDRDLGATVREFLPRFLASLKGADRSVSFSSGRLSWDYYDEDADEFVSVEIDKRGGDGRLTEKAFMQRLRLARVREGGGDQGLELVTRDSYIMRVLDGDPSVDYTDEAPVAMGHVESIGASTLFNQFFGAARFLYRPRNLTVPELLYAVERGGVARGSVRESKIALHGRLALGAAAFFLGIFAVGMMLVVPPTGRRIRDFMLCFGPAVLIFFPLQIAGPAMARNLPMPIWLSMWAPNILLFVLAAILLAKAFRR